MARRARRDDEDALDPVEAADEVAADEDDLDGFTDVEDDDEDLDGDEDDELDEDFDDADPADTDVDDPVGSEDDVVTPLLLDEDDVAEVVADDDDEDGEDDELRDGEFICRSCFMAKRESALVDADLMLCRDCA